MSWNINRNMATRLQSLKSFSSFRKENIVKSSDVNGYAVKHEAFCRQSLKVPPVQSSYIMDRSSRHHATKNLFNYLSWRKWDPQYLSNPYSYAMISHALTYPLTMASNAFHFQREKEKSVIRLCCVGARSEAYLPDDYWREFLHFCTINSFETQPSKWQIDFVGHDLPSHMKSRTISLIDSFTNTQTLASDKIQNHTGVLSSLQMTFTSGLLHNHVRELYKTKSVQEILSLWDGFVLFNPGIGHPNLESSWYPTLKFILNTKKPALITAHSELDSQRDGNILKKHCGELFTHDNNPFSSLMAYEDPFPPETGVQHLVRPNHSVLLI